MDIVVSIVCGLAVIAVAGYAIWSVMEARTNQRKEAEQKAQRTGGSAPTL